MKLQFVQNWMKITSVKQRIILAKGVFVFDDRLAVPISKENMAPVIGIRHHCEIASDIYYNCANMAQYSLGKLG